MGATRYALGDRLPPDVQVGGNSIWTRYQRYPVFSLRWLLGRMQVFAVVIGAFALFTGLAVRISMESMQGALLSGGYLFVGFMLMANTGPVMATLVRHRRWPEPRERVGVVLAWVAGVVIAYFVDEWASGGIEAAMEGYARSDESVAAARKAAADMDGIAKSLALALNLLVLAAIYGLAGGGLALRAYFGERRRWEASLHQHEVQALRSQKRDADLRLGVLQAQVEPHFLFNTLASVRALVSRDPARAEATLDALVNHLRATIPRLGEGEARLESTLGQQIDVCTSYLDVMRLRTADRLSHGVDVDPALRRLPYPPMLLLTLVENAVKHGIEPKPGPGRIEIRARREAGQLVVAVVDDGAGLVPAVGGGMGLANVRGQLAARFGDRASLRLQGREGDGAVAEIRTPLQEAAST